MKFAYSLFFSFLTLPLHSQVKITVNVDSVVRPLTGNENGINLNYLMDGSYLSPATSTTQALSRLKVKVLRYPGGEKSDNYLFSKAPYSSASPRVALTDTCFWPTNDYKFVDTNSAEKVCWPTALDFDEFMEMCKSVGASPLVVVAYDAAYNTKVCNGKPTKAQLLTNAVEWVRYANVTKKWNVKYWMIGNESWNDPGYNGRVTPQKYAADLFEFASAMKEVDPTIKIIANGRSDWWQTILQSNAASEIDFVGLSEYPVLGYTGGYEYYRKNDVNLTGEVDLAISDINTFAADRDKQRIKVIATEYNSIDWNNQWPAENNLGHALVNFQMFGDLVKKPQVYTACMWNTRWVDNRSGSLYDALDRDGGENANGTALRIWGENLLSRIVFASSDTSFVKCYASYDDDGKRLNVMLLNKESKPVEARLMLDKYESEFTGSVWQFNGTSVSDLNPVYRMTDSVVVASDADLITLAANSVTVVKLHKGKVAEPVKLVTLQPNPFNGSLQLRLKSDTDRMVAINIFDVIGRRVHHEQRMLSLGSNTLMFDNLSALKTGVYMIKVGDSRTSNTVKVVKR